MKKILSIIMSIVMLISITAGLDLTANAEVLTGNCGADGSNVTYTLDTSTGVLTISGTGEMRDFLYSSYVPWYSNRSSVKTVTISSGVTSIGGYAFDYCSSLTSITIPDSVTSIGYAAFESCSSLTSITIPNSVTSIGNDAFSHCSSLTSIKIPNSVTSIGNYAFWNCSSLTSITISNSVTSIGNNAFYVCSSLTSITIPNSVTSIGKEAFEHCSSLTSVTIGNSLTSIGDRAFYNCSSLTSITVDSNNQNFSSQDGVLFDKNKTTLIQYPIGNTRTSYAIPNSVTSIGNYAFRGCSSLTSVTIPNSVTSIGNYAFEDCDSLTSITIPNSVTSIGDHAFNSCNSLTSATIGNSVTSIGDYTFQFCSSLKSVTIPDSVTSIGNAAFYSCSRLKNVYYTGTSSQWKNISIGDYNDKLKNANINYSTVKSPISESLEFRLKIDTGVMTISGNGAIPSRTSSDASLFCGYDSYIKSVEIESGVTGIGNYAFEDCSSLTNVTIGNSVTSIGDYAFNSCRSLASVTIPSSVTSIGNYAFEDCSSLTNVTIGNSVTSIGDYAFNSCRSLASVTIGNSVTSIGDYAFNSCRSLASVTIPSRVTSIGNYAFEDCSSLTSITVDSNNQNYSSRDGVLFNKNKTALLLYPQGNTSTSYVISDSVTNVWSSAFSGCKNLKSVSVENPNCVLESNSIPSSITIYAHSDSKAQKYASENGNNFISTHIWNDGVETSNGCTVSGVKTFTCKICGITKQEAVSAPGHKYTTVVTAPTCTERGYTTYTCSVCGYNYISDYVNAIGHNVVIDSAVPATCTSSGMSEGSHCSVCSTVLSKQEYIPAYGHSFTNYVSNNDATCTKDGTKTAKCDRCSATNTITDTGSKTEHNYKKTVIASTCTERGYTTYRCSTCGDNYVSDYTNALGHSFSNYISDNNATCTSDGTKTSKCSRCSVTDTKTDVGSKLGHNYTSAVISPTCTTGGYTTHTCTRCNDSYVDSNTSPLGHSYKTTVTSPTCTANGYTTYTCTKCGNSYIDNATSQLGHSFTTYFSDNNATCTKDGTKTAKCDRCSATNTVTDTGSMVAHNLAKTVVAPNCTDNGYTVYTCTVCGGSYKDNIVNATGHTFSEVVREPATCNREGTMDHVCEICQYAYSTVIPATGQHNYGADGKCIYCNAYNTAAVVSVDGVSYTLNSDKEYVSSKAKKASLSKATGGKKQFKVTWKKVSGVAGYQIQYSTDKKLKKNNKNVTAKKSSTSATIKKLKSKKTYYVRIRTYKTVKINGKSTKVYSSWSKVKTVKTK